VSAATPLEPDDAPLKFSGMEVHCVRGATPDNRGPVWCLAIEWGNGGKTRHPERFNNATGVLANAQRVHGPAGPTEAKRGTSPVCSPFRNQPSRGLPFSRNAARAYDEIGLEQAMTWIGRNSDDVRIWPRDLRCARDTR